MPSVGIGQRGAALLAALALLLANLVGATARATPLSGFSTMFGTAPGTPLANDYVNTIVVAGDDIYVGGYFTNFAGVATADAIARWNSSTEQWEGLGAADGGGSVFHPGDWVQAILVDAAGGSIYVGGHFANLAGTTGTANLARFDIAGQSWHAVGPVGGASVISGWVNALALEGSSLYVGGRFSDAAGIAAADYIVRGNATACGFAAEVSGCLVAPSSIEPSIDPPTYWSALGANWSGDGAIPYDVNAIVADPEGGVVVGGDFASVDGVPGAPFGRVAHFDAPTSTWSSLGGSPTGTVWSLAARSGDIIVAGWDGALRRSATAPTWARPCNILLGTDARALAAPSYSDLFYLGQDSGDGSLLRCDMGEPLGSGWTSFPTETVNVQALADYKGRLLVGGTNQDYGGLADADYLAIFDDPALMADWEASGAELPETSQQGDERLTTAMLLFMTALTALAGTQLLRRT